MLYAGRAASKIASLKVLRIVTTVSAIAIKNMPVLPFPNLSGLLHVTGGFHDELW